MLAHVRDLAADVAREVADAALALPEPLHDAESLRVGERACDAGRAHAIGLVFYRPSPRYVDPDAAAEFVKSLGYGDNDIHVEPKLRSPAQMEKLVGAKQKKLLEPLIDSRSSGTVLAPASDKRPAVTSSAAEDFAT